MELNREDIHPDGEEDCRPEYDGHSHHGHQHSHDHEHQHCHGCCHEDHCDDGCGCEHGDAKFDKRTVIEMIICVVLAVAGIVVQSLTAWYWALPLFLAAYFVIGYPVLQETAEHCAKGKIFDENLLMTVATVGAFFLGDYAEAVGVMLFFRIGELIQSISVGRSKRSINSLMAVRPDFARVVRDRKSETVAPSEISVGDRIEVRAGERIPLDGVIERGNSYLDTSAITGEPVKRRVSEGDEVLSGCINSDGLLLIRVTKPFAESTVSRILKIVEDSAAQKAPTEKFITRFCRYYTPAVVLLALMVAVIPSLIAGHAAHWIHTALTFLVISCPCALVLSVPLSYFCGIGACSRKGVLVKGGLYLETAAKLDGVAFDKTGTLTYGNFQVQQVIPEEKKEKILELCYAAEFYSNHPIADAVKARFEGNIEASDLSEFSEIAGGGVSVIYKGKKIIAGNRKFLAENGVLVSAPETDGTEINIACDGEYVGSVTVGDTLKENAAEAVATMKRAGIGSFALLTGDAQKPAGEIAARVGIDQVYANLLPKDKAEVFRSLSENKTYAFVGDGINDAPVLTVAPIGISVGGIGSDAAVEASDVVLMRDDLSGIAVLKKIGRKTCAVVRRNVAMVLAVKLAAMILGIFGLLPMWGAVFADVGACLLAVLNATVSLSGRNRKEI